MQGTGSVVFFMLGIGLLWFAWNSKLLDAMIAFLAHPTVGGQ